MAKTKKANKLHHHDLSMDSFISQICEILDTPVSQVCDFSQFCEIHGLPVDPPHDERYSMASRRLKREVEIMRANGWQVHPELIHGQRVWVRRPLSHEQVLALRGNVED